MANLELKPLLSRLARIADAGNLESSFEQILEARNRIVALAAGNRAVFNKALCNLRPDEREMIETVLAAEEQKISGNDAVPHRDL